MVPEEPVEPSAIGALAALKASDNDTWDSAAVLGQIKAPLVLEYTPLQVRVLTK
jgi:hypothetical protein